MFEVAPSPTSKAHGIAAKVRLVIEDPPVKGKSEIQRRVTWHEFARAVRVHDPEDGGSGWQLWYRCQETGRERIYGFVGTRGSV